MAARRRAQITVSILLGLLGLALPAAAHAAAAATSAATFGDTDAYLALLKADALAQVQAEASSAHAFAGCFRGQGSCPAAIQASLGDIEQAIRQRSRIYRQLVGLISISDVLNGTLIVRPFTGIPLTTFDKSSPAGKQEYFDLLALERNEENTIVDEWKARQAAKLPPQAGVSNEESFKNRANEERKLLYQKQFLDMVSRNLFLMFIDSPNPNRSTIAAAFEKVANYNDKTLKRLNDPQRTTAEQFLLFGASRKRVLAQNPQFAALSKKMLDDKDKQANALAWLKDNAVDIGVTSCIVVASFAEAWPVTLFCAGLDVSSNLADTIGRWSDYSAAYQNWISGLDTYGDLQDATKDAVYSTILLAATSGWAGDLKEEFHVGGDLVKEMLGNVHENMSTLRKTGGVIFEMGSDDFEVQGGAGAVTGLPKSAATAELTAAQLIDLPNGKGQVFVVEKGFITYASTQKLKKFSMGY